MYLLQWRILSFIYLFTICLNEGITDDTITIPLNKLHRSLQHVGTFLAEVENKIREERKYLTNDVDSKLFARENGPGEGSWFNFTKVTKDRINKVTPYNVFEIEKDIYLKALDRFATRNATDTITTSKHDETLSKTVFKSYSRNIANINNFVTVENMTHGKYGFKDSTYGRTVSKEKKKDPDTFDISRIINMDSNDLVTTKGSDIWAQKGININITTSERSHGYVMQVPEENKTYHPNKNLFKDRQPMFPRNIVRNQIYKSDTNNSPVNTKTGSHIINNANETPTHNQTLDMDKQVADFLLTTTTTTKREAVMPPELEFPEISHLPADVLPSETIKPINELIESRGDEVKPPPGHGLWGEKTLPTKLTEATINSNLYPGQFLEIDTDIPGVTPAGVDEGPPKGFHINPNLLIPPPTTETTPFVAAIKNDMAKHAIGPFSAFLIKLFHIISYKNEVDLRNLGWGFLKTITWLDAQGRFNSFGPLTIRALEDLATAAHRMPKDMMKSSAIMLHEMMTLRRQAMSSEVNRLIDFIDSLYTKKETANLLYALEKVNDYPNTTEIVFDVVRNMVDQILIPYGRLVGTYKGETLVALLHKVIAEHFYPEHVYPDYEFTKPDEGITQTTYKYRKFYNQRVFRNNKKGIEKNMDTVKYNTHKEDNKEGDINIYKLNNHRSFKSNKKRNNSNIAKKNKEILKISTKRGDIIKKGNINIYKSNNHHVFRSDIKGNNNKIPDNNEEPHKPEIKKEDKSQKGNINRTKSSKLKQKVLSNLEKNVEEASANQSTTYNYTEKHKYKKKKHNKHKHKRTSHKLKKSKQKHKKHHKGHDINKKRHHIHKNGNKHHKRHKHGHKHRHRNLESLLKLMLRKTNDKDFSELSSELTKLPANIPIETINEENNSERIKIPLNVSVTTNERHNAKKHMKEKRNPVRTISQSEKLAADSKQGAITTLKTQRKKISPNFLFATIKPKYNEEIIENKLIMERKITKFSTQLKNIKGRRPKVTSNFITTKRINNSEKAITPFLTDTRSRFNIKEDRRRTGTNKMYKIYSDKKNTISNKIRAESSGSDDEMYLKKNIYKALNTRPRSRKSQGSLRKKKPIDLRVSSYSNEEAVLKSKIYKVFGYDFGS